METIYFEVCNDMQMDRDKYFKFCVSLKEGYKITKHIAEADYVIIYACPFGEAKIKSAQKIAQICQNSNANSKVIVTGCFIRVYDVTNVAKVETMEWQKLVEIFCDNYGNIDLHRKLNNVADCSVQNVVIISEGCRKKCSYCIYGKLFPKYKSKSIEQIYNEVSLLAKLYDTIYLTGAQETSDYGVDFGNGSQFVGLMDLLAFQFPMTKFVVGWYHISGLNDEMLDCLYRNKNIIGIMLHIQHTSQKLLKMMNRPSFEYSDKKLRELKKLRPDMEISTEFIIGFPNETDEEFNQLLRDIDKYIKDGILDDIAVAVYEQVEGTVAGKLPQIDGNTKNDRLNKFMTKFPKSTKYVCPEHSDEIIKKLYGIRHK